MNMPTRTIVALCAAVVLSAAAALGGSLDLSWYTVDGGGGYSAGGSFELEGTIGQLDAGPSAGALTGGNFKLSGGFWFEQPPGDCNATGTVNLLDYVDLEACLSGPDGGLGAGCECFDFDDDGDNDLVDFAVFMRNFTG